MSRPYKEVIFYNKLDVRPENGTIGLKDLNGVRFGNNSSKVYKLWGGSIQQFINDFELPQDFIRYWQTSTNNTTENAFEVVDFYHNTINFKVNLQFWFRLSNQDNLANFAPSCNLTLNITLPDYLSYKMATVGYPNRENLKPYNPNIFPITLVNTSWTNSNKNLNNYNGNTWGAGLGNSTPFLIFRYNVEGQDIQICIANLSSGSWEVNGSQIYLAQASLTFLGFNATKKIERV